MLSVDIRDGNRIYLGCPYSGGTEEEAADRAAQVTRAAGLLMKMGYLVMSPVTMGHQIRMSTGVPGDWEYWKNVCKWQMSGCDQFVVLKLDGWEDSVGIKGEELIANDRGMTIVYTTMDDIESMWERFARFSELNDEEK